MAGFDTNPKIQHQARRLRELFRGRFDQSNAERLIREFDGEEPAIDFIMTEDPEQVTRFLKQSPEYLTNLRKDCEAVATILNNPVDSVVRQFACGPCNRAWWRRVPVRKQVTRCRRCFIKYDPIPRGKESGWGKFICTCGNEFTGFGEMGVTTSDCYECGNSVSVDHMLPPRKKSGRKPRSKAPHSCHASNCYNNSQAFDYGDPGTGPNFDYPSYNFGYGQQLVGRRNTEPTGSARDPGQNPFDDTGGAYPGQPPVAVCLHPKSLKQTQKIRTVSQRHVSTGSTVSTFLSQGSMETGTVSVAYTMDRILENGDE